MSRRLDASQVDPAFVEWYANEMGKTSSRVAAEVLQAHAGNDLSDKLRQIKAPTLIITAEKFFLYSPKDIQEMQQLIPQARLMVFPGVSGFIQYARPEQCAQALLDFLGGL